MTCYDGGKALAGWGKYTGMVTFGWVFKLWGSTGTSNCGSGSVIVGYVAMVTTPFAGVSGGCLTAAQFAFNNTLTTATAVTISALFFNMAE